MDSPAKRPNRISPIRLLQPSYLHRKHAVFQVSNSVRNRSKSPVNDNLTAWMLPYHSLDRAVLLHQASVRFRGRHDLLNLQFRAQKHSYLSSSLVTLHTGNREIERTGRGAIEAGERLSIGSLNSFKYFNSTVIPDMRTRQVFLSKVNAHVAYFDRKHFR